MYQAAIRQQIGAVLGIAASARRLGYAFNPKSPLFWGLVLMGAYAFESVNFQMGEAFIVGFHHSGMGLYGLLFPILMGVFLPLSMVTLICLARRFWVVLPALGFNGLIGIEQAWTMSLSLLPLALVSSLALVPWARRRMLAAAPVFSIAMVLFSFIWFKQMPALQGYPITGFDLLLACGISALGGLVTGSLGVKLAQLASG